MIIFRVLKQFFINIGEICSLLMKINYNLIALAKIEQVKVGDGNQENGIYSIISNTMQE